MNDVFQALAGATNTLPPLSHKDSVLITGSTVDIPPATIPAAASADSVSHVTSNRKTPPAVAAKPKPPSPKQPSEHVDASK